MIDAICALFDIQPEQVMRVRETEDTVIVVIDYGIKGGKKFGITKSEYLQALDAIDNADADAEPESENAFDGQTILAKSIAEIKDMDLSADEWRNLLALEKDAEKPRSGLIKHITKLLEDNQ